MSYTVKFYNFTKRKNSTKIPEDSTTYFSENVVFKSPTSILAPSIIISRNNILTNTYSYCYIEEFERYYFVNNKITLGNDRVQFDLQLDYAGTYASNIKSYTGLISRSTSNFNALLPDDYFIPLLNNELPDSTSNEHFERYVDLFKSSGQSGNNKNISFTWTVNGSNGYTIFNTTNDPLVTLRELLNNSAWWNNFAFGVTDMTKYITSCVAVVGELSTAWSSHGSYANHNISVANATMSISNCIILDVTNPNECIWGTTDFDIKDLITLRYGADDFRRYTEPFTQIQVWIPFVGSVNVDPIHLRADRFHCNFKISPVNGNGRICLYAEYGNTSTPDIQELIGTYAINASMPIPLAVVTDLYQALSNNVPAMSEALTTGSNAWDSISNNTSGLLSDISSGISDALGGVEQVVNKFDGNNGVVNTLVDAFASFNPGFRHDSTIGSPGSLVDFMAPFNQIKIDVIQRASTSDNFKYEVGRKSLIRGNISNLGATGFIQFVKPSIQLPVKALLPERLAVNQLMSEGFYIE